MEMWVSILSSCWLVAIPPSASYIISPLWLIQNANSIHPTYLFWKSFQLFHRFSPKNLHFLVISQLDMLITRWSKSPWTLKPRRVAGVMPCLANTLTHGARGSPSDCSSRRTGEKLVPKKWHNLGMGQYLSIYIYTSIYIYNYIYIYLVGWTSIYQLFWCSPGVQGFDTLPSG